MRIIAIISLLSLIVFGSAAERTIADLSGPHGGISACFDKWLISATSVPDRGWLVMATTADEQPALLVDGFWQQTDQQAIPSALAACINDLLQAAKLPFKQRMAALRERRGHQHQRLTWGLGFSKSVGRYYMQYSCIGIGPHQREWVVVVEGFSAATHQGALIYSGPPETPLISEAISQADTDKIISSIDKKMQRAKDRRDKIWSYVE